jgi:hypothetical protein
MSKRKRYFETRERKQRCPLCSKVIEDPATALLTSTPKGQRSVLPVTGDLTECTHCRAVLEYWCDSSSISLQPAVPERVKAMKSLALEMSRDPSLSEVISHVRKYRQMPVQPLTAYRFREVPIRNLDRRQSGRVEASAERDPITASGKIPTHQPV